MDLRKIGKVVEIRKWLINLPMSFFFIENCKLKDSMYLADGKVVQGVRLVLFFLRVCGGGDYVFS